jgi:hypothetical protein
MTEDSLITTEGKARRVAIAATTFVSVLRSDERIRRAYADWRTAIGTERPTAVSVRRDLERVRKVVIDDLKLSYSWLPKALMIDFAATLDDDSAAFRLEAPPIPEIPNGRAPKNGGENIPRDVLWYYRAKVKDPADTVYAIAQEHRQAQTAAGINQGGLNHSKVQNAIARIDDLLRCLEDSDPI